MRYIVSTSAIIVTTLAAGHATGQDTFSVSGMTSDGSMISLTVGGSSIPDLVNNLADQEADFASFAGRPFSANLTYAGVQNAAAVTFNPNGGGMGVETVSITLLGTSGPVTFSEANGNLGEQLEDFFLKTNPDTITSFLQTINEQSSVAVADGNPLATSARSALYKFNRYGMFHDATPHGAQVKRRFGRSASRGTGLRYRGATTHTLAMASSAFGLQPTEPGPEIDATLETGPRTGSDLGGAWFKTRVDVGAATFEADDGALDGSEFTVAPSWETSYSERFALSLGIPLAYHEVNSSAVYNAGVHLDAPIRLILPDESSDIGMFWQIVPGAAIDVGASYDFAAGGVLLSYGATNVFQFSMGDFDLTLPTGFYIYDSVPIETDDIEFDSGVEQQIFKQGARLAYSPGQRFSMFGGVTYTDFLENAAIDNYWSPTAGLGWTFENGSNITLAYEGDFDTDDRFTRHGGRLTLAIPF